jgi:hypothetical protein
MTLYVLILALWVESDLSPHLEEQYLWAMDTGLSSQECLDLMEEFIPLVQMLDGELSCEIDGTGL